MANSACSDTSKIGAGGRGRTGTALSSRGIFLPATALAASPWRVGAVGSFVVWTIPSPWRVGALGAARLVSTPSRRSFDRSSISSVVCLFLAIDLILHGQTILQAGPLNRGQIANSQIGALLARVQRALTLAERLRISPNSFRPRDMKNIPTGRRLHSNP